MIPLYVVDIARQHADAHHRPSRLLPPGRLARVVAAIAWCVLVIAAAALSLR